MRIPLVFGILVGGFSMVGCSTFTTELKSSLIGQTTPGQTTPGLIYRLPAKQFSLSATYQVTDCEVVGEKVNLEANVTAILSERLVGSEAYTISYRDLDSWIKITNTEFHLSEAGLLTGINASIADQTGAVIQNTVAMATGIARAVALPPVPLMTEELVRMRAEISTISTLESNGINQKNMAIKRVEQSSCDKVKELVKVHEAAKTSLNTAQKNDKKRDVIKRKQGEAEAEIARLSALKDVYEALGKEAAKNGLMKRIQEKEKEREDATTELDRSGTSGTNKAAEALANAAAALTITTTKDTLPQNSGESFKVTAADNDIPSALRNFFQVNSPDLPAVTLQVCALSKANSRGENPDTRTGIAYRIPVAAMARVHYESTKGRRMLIEQPTQVPQFGPVGSLDLKNGAFANNTLEVAFNTATGAPEKLIFHSKSRAEAASASARDAASSYLQLQTDKRDDIRAANKAAIDQQTALLTLEKTRNDVTLAGAQAAATAALLPVTTEKSLVEAQIDLLRDQQRLDAVRTGTASTAEVQLEALVNQQKLLEQRLKILQIEQQIAEQKTKVKTDIAP